MGLVRELLRLPVLLAGDLVRSVVKRATGRGDEGSSEDRQPAGTSRFEEELPMPPEDLEISIPELKPLLEGDKVQLVDVREDYEVRAGMIPGAVHIPLGQLPMRFQEIPEGKPVVVYCAHGIRSFQGAYFLRTQGFEDAKSLTGGIVHWDAQGGAIVRP